MRAPRASTSPTTRTRTSGRAPGSSSSSRAGSRPAGPARSSSASPNGPPATASARSSAARGAAYTSPAGWADVRLGAFRNPRNLRWESHTLADVMHDTGHDAVDAICDLLLDENLAVNQVTSGPWTETLRPFVAHPVGMVGTDSTFVGAKPSPRTYGSFPRILGQFVRDEALLSLEEAVRKMTSAPAAQARPARTRDAAGRCDRRRRRLRSGDRSLDGHVRRAAELPDRDRDRHRQRHARRGRCGGHTGATPGRGIRLGKD